MPIKDPKTPGARAKRADAQKNYDDLLATAGIVVREQGANASLRDIARRAGVGLGTLYRHFPTRESLLEALLRTGFDQLAAKARELQTSNAPGDALVAWLRDVVSNATTFRGVAAAMVGTLTDETSALYASCHEMRAAGARLLRNAQAAHRARLDIDGTDLFTLAAALAWIGDQPHTRGRAEHLFDVIIEAILTSPKR